jgi:hypothetical protein
MPAIVLDGNHHLLAVLFSIGSTWLHVVSPLQDANVLVIQTQHQTVGKSRAVSCIYINAAYVLCSGSYDSL